MLSLHKDIHALIQRNADNALRGDERAILLEHIQDCSSCQIYADELHNLEGLLRQSMTKRWNAPHTPVSIEPIKQVTEQKTNRPARHLIFRLAAASVLVATLSLFLFQFSLTSVETPAYQVSASIPTPSLTVTNPIPNPVTCPDVLYVTREGDTLASLARKFAIPEEEIRRSNGIQSDALSIGTKLTIPTCNSTPTSATAPRVGTFTLTPFFDVSTTTPDS